MPAELQAAVRPVEAEALRRSEQLTGSAPARERLDAGLLRALRPPQLRAEPPAPDAGALLLAAGALAGLVVASAALVGLVAWVQPGRPA
jgi:hypothetical protein